METTINHTLDIIVDAFNFKAKTWGNPDTNKRILAIHGWLDNANTFDKIAPLLSQTHYVVAIDLAGHGLSSHKALNTDYYIWDYAIDVLHCMDALHWKNCTLIAHSLGTGVATIVAGAFPNRIEKLVFIDGLGAPFITEEDNLVLNFKTSYRQLKMAKKTGLYGFSKKDTAMFSSKEEAIQNRMQNKINPISYEAASCLINRGLIKIPGGYRWTHDPKIVLPECYKMTEKQVKYFIKSISNETLIILGKQGLFANGLYQSRLEAFHHAQIHWVAGHHHLHLENEYPAVVSLIFQFLQNKKIS